MAKDLVGAIKEKQAAIARLQAELDEARALLSGVHTGGRARVRFIPSGNATRTRKAKGSPVLPYKPGSSVGRAAKVLRTEGKPLHVDELLPRVQRRGHEVKKTTLVGNLSRYVNAGVVFNRPAPNTFGLLEWQEKKAAEGS